MTVPLPRQPTLTDTLFKSDRNITPDIGIWLFSVPPGYFLDPTLVAAARAYQSFLNAFLGKLVRFGSEIRCFLGGSVRFGSVGNFGRTTEFFGQKMPRNRAFSCKIFQLFHENCMDFSKLVKSDLILDFSFKLTSTLVCITLVTTLDPKFRISQYHVTPTPMRITCTQCPCKSRDSPGIQVYVLMRGEKREKETS
eukprot:sb/3470939/